MIARDIEKILYLLILKQNDGILYSILILGEKSTSLKFSFENTDLNVFILKTLFVNDIYENTLLTHIENLLENKKGNNIKLFHYHYFTLYKLIRNNISKLNSHVKKLVDIVLSMFEEQINLSTIIENAVDFIEKNHNILKYGDLTLYEHQKDIFTACKASNAKMVLYMAPTGTGKTLSPIALSEGHKIIFVCAARHVGLALAKAAISVNKKIAFAFGCSCADDVRLHYFAAKVFTRNKRTGGIGKVDNDRSLQKLFKPTKTGNYNTLIF